VPCQALDGGNTQGFCGGSGVQVRCEQTVRKGGAVSDPASSSPLSSGDRGASTAAMAASCAAVAMLGKRRDLGRRERGERCGVRE
jgi:hypothetical protein